MTKGYTVHFATANGNTACGVKPKTFMGKPAQSTDIRRVTCHQCELKYQTDAYNAKMDSLNAALDLARADRDNQK